MFGLSPLRLYIYAGAAAACLLLLGYARYEHHNAGEARRDRDTMQTERATARGERDRAVQANANQRLTIEAQSKALDKWLSLGITPEDVKELLEAAAAKRAELEQLIEDNAKQKAKDNANPDCEKLRATDFQRLCPNRARVLRRYEDRSRHKTD